MKPEDAKRDPRDRSYKGRIMSPEFLAACEEFNRKAAIENAERARKYGPLRHGPLEPRPGEERLLAGTLPAGPNTSAQSAAQAAPDPELEARFAAACKKAGMTPEDAIRFTKLRSE